MFNPNFLNSANGLNANLVEDLSSSSSSDSESLSTSSRSSSVNLEIVNTIEEATSSNQDLTNPSPESLLLQILEDEYEHLSLQDTVDVDEQKAIEDSLYSERPATPTGQLIDNAECKDNLRKKRKKARLKKGKSKLDSSKKFPRLDLNSDVDGEMSDESDSDSESDYENFNNNNYYKKFN